MQLGSPYAESIDFWCRDRRRNGGILAGQGGFQITVVEQAADVDPAAVRSTCGDQLSRLPSEWASWRGSARPTHACAPWSSSTRVDTWSAASTLAHPGPNLATLSCPAASSRRSCATRCRTTWSSVRQHSVGTQAGRGRRHRRTQLGTRSPLRLVVGADGAHSGVRALAFGPESDYLKHLGVYVATLPLDGETGTDLVMYNTPGRAVAIHPARRTRARRSCSAPPRSPSSITEISTNTSACYAMRMPGRDGVCPNCWTASGPPMTCTSTRSAGSRCRRGLAVADAWSVTPHRVSRCSGTAPVWR